MDGITTVTSLGILVGAVSLMAFNGNANTFWFAVALGVGASLIGFVPQLASVVMYMGDTGSQFTRTCFWPGSA